MTFWKYLTYHRRRMGVFLLCSGISAITFALYHLPLLAVLYPVLLCALIGIIVLLFDYRQMRKAHDALNRIQMIADEKAEPMPKPGSVLEEDYQALLHRFCQEHEGWLRETERQRTELVDYYTTWVHQIKTPTTSMRLHLQNEDSPLSRQLTMDLCHVEQYVDMVLTYLRLHGDSTDYVFREYDLDTILRRTLRKLSQEFILRRLRLVYEPLSYTVVTDKKWLGFVIEQVLTNALKYTPAGSITIRLVQERGHSILQIEDTGIGPASLSLASPARRDGQMTTPPGSGCISVAVSAKT